MACLNYADWKRRNVQELAWGQESIDPLLQVVSCPDQVIQRVSQHWRMLEDVIFVRLRDVVLLAQNFREIGKCEQKASKVNIPTQAINTTTPKPCTD